MPWKVSGEDRPHEALGMQTPASCYCLSPRQFPARVREPEYGSSMRVRRMHLRRQFSWRYEDVFLSETLIGERIGLQPIDDPSPKPGPKSVNHVPGLNCQLCARLEIRRYAADFRFAETTKISSLVRTSFHTETCCHLEM